MTLEIVPFTATLDARAKRWTTLEPEELRRRAIEACRDRDLETLWNIVEAYLVLHRTPSPHTLRVYHQGVRVAVQQLEQETITAPHRNWGHGFARALETTANAKRHRGVIKPATVRARLAAAKTLFAALRWSGATRVDPFSDVRLKPDPEAPEDKGPPYPPESIDAMLAHADPRDRVLVLLGAHPGLRVSEICAVTLEDVNLEARRLQVRHGKGDKPRKVNLSKRVCEAVAALGRSSGERLIPLTAQGARAAIRRLCLKAGVEYLGVHALRHASGTRLYRATKDLKAVARHLGHKNVETAAIYAKFADEEVRNVVSEW